MPLELGSCLGYSSILIRLFFNDKSFRGIFGLLELIIFLVYFSYKQHMSKKCNSYNKVTGCVFVCLFVCLSVPKDLAYC